MEAAAPYLPASQRNRSDTEVGGDFYDLFHPHGANRAAVLGEGVRHVSASSGGADVREAGPMDDGAGSVPRDLHIPHVVRPGAHLLIPGGKADAHTTEDLRTPALPRPARA